MNTKLNSLLPVAVAVSLAFGVAACDKKETDTTVGQKLDSAVATADRKTDQAGNQIKQGADNAGNQMAQATDTAGSKLKDAAITTSVNASLAADTNLSAMKIDVDTVDGRVTLTGTAPSDAARQRATEIAQQKDGVGSVDNRLTVKQ